MAKSKKKSSKKNKVTSDSSSVRSDRSALGSDISRYERGFNSRSIERAYAAEREAINAERAALTARREEDLANISQGFEDTRISTEKAQEREYGSRSTGLVTSGGGFLGATQSQEGVLQGLRSDQRDELTALETKKQAAIQQARNAYDDKDFALARELVKSAKDLENTIYTRKNAYSDKAIQLSRYAEQDKQTQFRNSLDIIDRTAASIYDTIQGMDANAATKIIRKYANDAGVDPTILVGKLSEIVQSKKDKISTSLSTLASKYVSAGIDPFKDTLVSARQKILNSVEYRQDITKGQADINNINSLITERNGGGDSFGKISPADEAKGINFLNSWQKYSLKDREEMKKLFKVDREFQSYVLKAANF